MTRWGVRLLMLMAIGAGPVNVAAAPITYQEAISGDLDVSVACGGACTAFTFDGGFNTIAGEIHSFPADNSRDFDAFVFTLPAGTQLIGVTFAWTLHPSERNEDAGVTWGIRDGGNTGPLLASAPVNLYAVAQPLNLFAPAMPLGPGTYGLVNPALGPTTLCCGWSADYTWTFEVEGTAVPEPGSLILLGSGAAALALRRRRRRS